MVLPVKHLSAKGCETKEILVVKFTQNENSNVIPNSYG